MYPFQKDILPGGIPTTLQAVYVNHEDNLDADIEKLVETYNRRLPPSRLLFICPFGIEKELKESLDSRWDEFKGRLSSVSHLVIAPYGKDGQLMSDQVARPEKLDQPDWIFDDDFLEELAINAVEMIFDKTNTMLHAPHGYMFRKASKRDEDIFVRAGNMLRESDCLVVFSYLLLRKLPPKCDLIYIDSFTILSFALGLQSLVGYFRRSDSTIPALTIENIHSYEIRPDFRIPNEPNYFILISASTSGGFARKLMDEQRAAPYRIVHLLGVAPPGCDRAFKTFKDSCIYFKERTPPLRPKSASQQNTLIEIGTEEFLVAQGPPRSVAIKHGHVNQHGARELHKPFYHTALRIHGPSPHQYGSHSTFSVSFKAENVDKAELGKAGCHPVRKWVFDHLAHELPASVSALVHIGDPMSESLASWVDEALKGKLAIESLSKIKELMNNGVTVDDSVVVVAHHDPGLEGLRKAAIALRQLKHMNCVHRHFLIGYAFPPSQTEHDRLKDDLRRGPGGPRQYGWSEYLVLPVGAAPLHESLTPSFSDIFDDDPIEASRGKLGKQLAKALSEWNDRTFIKAEGLFLPSTKGNRLTLRPDSVFFPDAKEPDVPKISQIAVYAMVSAAMQAAREPEASSSKNSAATPRFDNNPLVRSVLDPSMFARYNDGILQASLLRSAQRSEVDYSASDDLSRQFTSICQSVFVNCHHDAGEAALEFVYALATEKISLRSADSDRLREEIRRNPVLETFWNIVKPEEDEPPSVADAKEAPK